MVVSLARHAAGPGGLGRGDGLLSVRPEGYGFLRWRAGGASAQADDIYVSQSQIRRLRLQPGNHVAGLVRCQVRRDAPGAGPRRGRGRAFPDAGAARVPFRYLTPVVPHRPFALGYPDGPETLRMLDVLAPIVHGHRVVVLPTRSTAARATGRSGAGTRHNHPDTRVLVLAVDQRPEALAALQPFAADPAVELFPSTFDEPPQRHADLATLVAGRVQRLVEAGVDTLLLVDSWNALVQAGNLTVTHSGRILSAGLDSNALLTAKQLLASARQTEEGASLTVVGCLLDAPESHTARTVAEQLDAVANGIVVLDRELVTRGVWPGSTAARRTVGGTPRPEPYERRGERLRSALDRLPVAAAHEQLQAWLREAPDEARFEALLDDSGS
ncbi:MAG: hypothetical protein H6837_11365 [Planctomycetes bacterium]|nr:hypothetical protein [Planctomycetota bacterium]